MITYAVNSDNGRIEYNKNIKPIPYLYFFKIKDNSLLLYRDESKKFEQVVEINCLNNYNKKITLAGPNLLFTNISDFLNKVKDYKNFTISTSRSNDVFVSNVDSFKSCDLGIFEKKYKLTIDRKDNIINVDNCSRIYSTTGFPTKTCDIAYKQYIERLSFDLKNSTVCYFPNQLAYGKDLTLYNKTNNVSPDICFQTNKEIINDIYNLIVEYYKKNNIEFDENFIPLNTKDLIHLANNPVFPQLSEMKLYFTDFREINKVSKAEQIKKVKEFLQLKPESNVELILQKSFTNLLVYKELLLAGVKDVKRIEDILSKHHFFNPSTQQYLVINSCAFDEINRVFATLGQKKLSVFFKECLEKMSEKEFLDMLSHIEDFDFDFFDIYEKMKLTNIFTKNVLDRCTYNRFNATATSICNRIYNERILEVYEKCKKEADILEDSSVGKVYSFKNSRDLAELYELCYIRDGRRRTAKPFNAIVSYEDNKGFVALCFSESNTFYGKEEFKISLSNNVPRTSWDAFDNSVRKYTKDVDNNIVLDRVFTSEEKDPSINAGVEIFF